MSREAAERRRNPIDRTGLAHEVSLRRRYVQDGAINRINTLISETSRINRAKIVARIALHALSETGKEMVTNPLPYASAATVAGTYTWLDNGNPIAIALGIGFGVITGALVEEWQKGPGSLDC
jgi:hypothetical protein